LSPQVVERPSILQDGRVRGTYSSAG
jgi:hypothetical protein